MPESLIFFLQEDFKEVCSILECYIIKKDFMLVPGFWEADDKTGLEMQENY